MILILGVSRYYLTSLQRPYLTTNISIDQSTGIDQYWPVKTSIDHWPGQYSYWLVFCQPCLEWRPSRMSTSLFLNNNWWQCAWLFERKLGTSRYGKENTFKRYMLVRLAFSIEWQPSWTPFWILLNAEMMTKWCQWNSPKTMSKIQESVKTKTKKNKKQKKKKNFERQFQVHQNVIQIPPVYN